LIISFRFGIIFNIIIAIIINNIAIVIFSI
jgi:hypothetical protein